MITLSGAMFLPHKYVSALYTPHAPPTYLLLGPNGCLHQVLCILRVDVVQAGAG